MTDPQRVTREAQCASCEAALTLHLDGYHPEARLRQMYVCPACSARREGSFPGRVVQVIRRWEKPDAPAPPRVPVSRPRVNLLTPYNPDVGPERVGAIWTVKSRHVPMTCSLLTHARGWEVRVTVSNQLIQSHVCRTEQAVFDTAEAWWADAIGKGWTDR